MLIIFDCQQVIGFLSANCLCGLSIGVQGIRAHQGMEAIFSSARFSDDQ